MFNGDMGSGKSLILEIMTKNNNKFKGEVYYEEAEVKNVSNNLL